LPIVHAFGCRESGNPGVTISKSSIFLPIPRSVGRFPLGIAKDGFMRGNPVSRDLNVLALLKGNERYVYIYDDAGRSQLVNALRDDAANPRLSLSWLDVAFLTTKVREQGRTAADEPPAESRV
jgi:hypothetical protein